MTLNSGVMHHSICLEWLKKITINESEDSREIEEALHASCWIVYWRLINVTALNWPVTVNWIIVGFPGVLEAALYSSDVAVRMCWGWQ